MKPSSDRPGVCLFCGASEALPASARAMARDFGTACAAEGWRLVYGGGSRGLMGEAARAASAAGGAVLGVIPAALRRIEQDHQGLGAHTVLEVVDTLAERKARMAAAADAFITLPGGVGTLDELFEMITWNDLSIHDKPIVLCHDDGFWDPLLQWLERARSAGAIRPIATRRLYVAQSLPEALQLLRQALADDVKKTNKNNNLR